MVGLQTLDLAIGVRVPASQPKSLSSLRTHQRRALFRPDRQSVRAWNARQVDVADRPVHGYVDSAKHEGRYAFARFDDSRKAQEFTHLRHDADEILCYLRTSGDRLGEPVVLH